MVSFWQFPTEQINTKNSKNGVFVFVLLRAIFGFDRGQPTIRAKYRLDNFYSLGEIQDRYRDVSSLVCYGWVIVWFCPPIWGGKSSEIAPPIIFLPPPRKPTSDKLPPQVFRIPEIWGGQQNFAPPQNLGGGNPDFRFPPARFSM